MPFDPYQQWLQIPPQRQPPTSYALLGLPEGEADPERIHQSASERYEHVRKYILGPHREQAQRILTELSRAVSELTGGPGQPMDPRASAAASLGPGSESMPGPGAMPGSAPPAGEAGVARVSAQTVVESPSGKTWPASFRDWLKDDGEPADLYHLLGRLRFDPDREGMAADVLVALDDLVPYQRHHHPRLARRAARLERLLALAEQILADGDRLQAYGDVLQRRLREAYLQAAARDQQPWTADRLLHWLEREQWVHPYALAATARNLTVKNGLETIWWQTGPL